MKRVLVFFVFGLVFCGIVTGGSVGISPAYYIEHFEPNLEKIFSFRAFNPNNENGIGVSLEGELAKYANISETFIKGGSPIVVNLKLPEKLDRPGTHYLYIRIIEAKNDSEAAMIGTLASIRVPIKIMVPYPGQYTESTFNVNNINEGEDADYELEIQNLGTEDVVARAVIGVSKVNKYGEKILEAELDDLFIETRDSMLISKELDTSSFEAGEYYAMVRISYSNRTEIVEDVFRVGEFMVEIIDYDYMFESERINQFNILIGNKWNTKIDSIYGDVSITDEGEVASSFRTISVDTNPWEIKNITGFFDTTNMEVGRYLANIKIRYGNSSTYKLVAIYVEDPPKERNYLIYALIVVAVLSLGMIIGFIILITRLKKLKGQLGRNDKKK